MKVVQVPKLVEKEKPDVKKLIIENVIDIEDERNIQRGD